MWNYTVSVHGYNNGGPNSYEDFRIAWSADPNTPADSIDFRYSHARQLVAAGLAGVEYVRGAFARSNAVSRAHRAAMQASEQECREFSMCG